MHVFKSVRKTVKVILKLNCSNSRPASISPNIKKKKKEGLVYKKIIKFLNDNNLIYLFQFGVLHSYSTNHASNNLKDMGKDLDEGKVGCGIFVDLQKTFDTVEHNVLLEKLEHYGICGIANKSFKSYPSDRTQFASINGFISSHAMLMEFSKAL